MAISPRSPGARDAYAAAGVDIDEGERLVSLVAPMAKSTARPGADAALGGFGGAFDLKAAGYRDPILISGTDGVGTKLRVAIDSGRLNTVGIDLVAMCVNDILAQGAEPLFFLDYFATGKLDADAAAAVVSGVAEGCRQAGCALIGGETAEMPGMYARGDFDLAGFCVGAVERDAVLPKTDAMMAGDVLIALPSSGPHSNGYSLIRKIVADQGLAWADAAPFDDTQSLGEALLAPTRIYVRTLAPFLKAGRIKGLAHITGGGLIENPPRMTPDHLTPVIDYGAWTLPPVFVWLKEAGRLDDYSLRRTLNCGVGMLVCVAEDVADGVLEDLKASGEAAFIAGRLTAA